MGKAYAQFENTPLIEKVLITQTARDYSVWWDNVTTKNVTETKQDIVNTSFKNAFAFLSNMLGENVDAWQWQRVVSVEHKHAVGEVPALRRFFNVGPFVTAGGDQVINNQIYNIDSTGLYKVKAGPSTRRIIDFSDVENSLGIVPTGQSGRVFSAHYKDQAEAYLKGDFKPMKLNKIQIERSENKLILQPDN
jgi:Protein related to penicillin acylase